MTISNFVAYVKQAWKNKPDTSTPLSAARLTHLEDGIKGNSDAIEKIAAAVVSQIVNDPNKIASMASLYSVNQAVTQLNSDLGGLAAKIEVQQKNNIDICTLSTGLYYCVNCKNMPPQWVGCYLQVMRLDGNWCYMIAYEPYNGTNAIATTKCYEGTWSGWIQRAQ